jgi:hypothetical protein
MGTLLNKPKVRVVKMHMCHVVNELDNFVLLSPHSTCFQLLFNKIKKYEKKIKSFCISLYLWVENESIVSAQMMISI